jgi:carbon-monoxide dehydrogenase medium subunit
MRAFELYTATDARHAVALLAEHAGSVKVLAGGTDLLVELKSAAHVPRAVVDISRAADLKEIAITPRGLAIGALATHSDILRSALVRELCPALAEAAHAVGAVQTRNLGTLGGNLVTCVPSMDSGPALVALDAEVTIAGARGTRRLALADFFVAPRKTALAAGELLTEIVVPARSLRKPARFVKFGLRKGQALALVNAAAALHAAGDPPAFEEVRIALGAVAPTVMRAREAEASLEGRTITPEAMAEAGRIAAAECKPITDFRASAEYRRDLVAVLVKRALEHAATQARAAREGGQ